MRYNGFQAATRRQLLCSIDSFTGVRTRAAARRFVTSAAERDLHVNSAHLRSPASRGGEGTGAWRRFLCRLYRPFGRCSGALLGGTAWLTACHILQPGDAPSLRRNYCLPSSRIDDAAMLCVSPSSLSPPHTPCLLLPTWPTKYLRAVHHAYKHSSLLARHLAILPPRHTTARYPFLPPIPQSARVPSLFASTLSWPRCNTFPSGLDSPFGCTPHRLPIPDHFSYGAGITCTTLMRRGAGSARRGAALPSAAPDHCRAARLSTAPAAARWRSSATCHAPARAVPRTRRAVRWYALATPLRAERASRDINERGERCGGCNGSPLPPAYLPPSGVLRIRLHAANLDRRVLAANAAHRCGTTTINFAPRASRRGCARDTAAARALHGARRRAALPLHQRRRHALLSVLGIHRAFTAYRRYGAYRTVVPLPARAAHLLLRMPRARCTARTCHHTRRAAFTTHHACTALHYLPALLHAHCLPPHSACLCCTLACKQPQHIFWIITIHLDRAGSCLPRGSPLHACRSVVSHLTTDMWGPFRHLLLPSCSSLYLHLLQIAPLGFLHPLGLSSLYSGLAFYILLCGGW